MGEEKHRIERELHDRTEEISALANEAESLREQILKEQESRNEQVAKLVERLRSLEQNNEQLQDKLFKLESQSSTKLSDVTTVKKEIVAKTMALEKAVREFQQGHQDKLFSRIWSVTSSMNSLCTKPDASLQMGSPRATDESLPQSNGRGAAVEASPGPEEDLGSATAALDAETQQALKRRLQSLGDVVVYTNAKFEACAASGRPIPPGALRVRPRRCDHVFLVECLMPYWAEGLCPVCRCSFAFDRPQDVTPGMDDCDRYSSVSTSVSQVASLSLPRLPFHSSSNVDGSVLRGPRAASRGRSPSMSRTSGRHRSTSRGVARSDVSGNDALRRGVGSPSPPRERLSVSPSRSAASPRSHDSSANPRHNASQIGTGRPL